MTKAFKASRLMGLLALALGLVAFSATAAQAEPGAYWEVVNSKGEATKIEGTSTLLPSINAKAETEGILLTKVGLSKVEILCPKISFKEAKLHTLGRATGKIHFTECITKLNGTTANACVPHSPGAANGLIETNLLHGLLKLHILKNAEGKEIGKDDLFELLPTKVKNEKGEEVTPPFATLVLGKAAPEKNECAIGEKFDVTGTAFLKDCLGNTSALENKVEHLFEEGPLTALFFGANPATIDGSALAFLTGEHEGMKFSGHPN